MLTALLRRCRTLPILMLPVLICLGLARPGGAHDLPAEIRVQMYAQPVDERLQVAVRVPLALLEGMALPKRGPGYLDFRVLDEPLERSANAVAQAFPFFADGERVYPAQGAWRVSMPSEDAFGSLAQARAHVLGPALPDEANVFWNQGYFDAYFEYPIPRADADFALLTDVRGLSGILKLDLHFQPADGSARRFELHGDHGLLKLDPTWHETLARFLGSGLEAALANLELLLFLACLVLPFRLVPLRRLAAALGLLAAAQAVMVVLAGAGLVPQSEWLLPVMAVLVALALVVVAVEDVVAGWRRGRGALRLAPAMALVAGIAFGLGLTPLMVEELQFAGAWQGLALAGFAAGLAAAIGAVAAVALPVLQVALPRTRARQLAMVIAGALIAHTGWHWLLERVEALRYVRWPAPGEASGTVAAVVLLTIAAGIMLWRSRGRLLAETLARGGFPGRPRPG